MKHPTSLAAHLALSQARPGGAYRLCPCGWWHLYDTSCPTGHSDALTAAEYAASYDTGDAS